MGAIFLILATFVCILPSVQVAYGQWSGQWSSQGPWGGGAGHRRGGERCSYDQECVSNFCFRGVCGVESGYPGKVGTNGPCHSHHNCYTGQCDVSRQTCAGGYPYPGIGTTYPGYGHRPIASSCRSDNDCQSRRCVGGYCITGFYPIKKH